MSSKSLNFFWDGYRESRRCSKDTYRESYTTKNTSIRKKMVEGGPSSRRPRRGSRGARIGVPPSGLSATTSSTTRPPLTTRVCLSLSFTHTLSLTLPLSHTRTLSLSLSLSLTFFSTSDTRFSRSEDWYAFNPSSSLPSFTWSRVWS